MKTVDLSGMGGGYENVCQKMLANGVKWIEAHPEEAKKLEYRTLHSIYGIAIPDEGSATQEFEKALTDGIDDATGAMHQCVVGHCLYIAQNGREKWFKVATEDNSERAFDWDGTASSCPKTDISTEMDKREEEKCGALVKEEGRSEES